MTTLPDGTYNIINKVTGLYVNLAQSVVAPYTPIIAWPDSGVSGGAQNARVTFALLYHFIRIIDDLCVKWVVTSVTIPEGTHYTIRSVLDLNAYASVTIHALVR